MQKVKVSAISYLNTVPFVYGLENCAVAEHIELSFNHPAECAKLLREGKVDLGIIPAAAVPDLPEYYIVSDFCIGATGKVRSVALYASSPLHEIDTIFLDFESRTSVLLCQVLAKYHWAITPDFKPLGSLADVRNELKRTGYVLIGDKTFDVDGLFSYKYDLAEAWVAFRKQPFAFAVWAANKPLGSEFTTLFNSALRFGVENIEKAVAQNVKNFDKQLALDYLHNNISYTLDDAKRRAIADFWKLALGEIKSNDRC